MFTGIVEETGKIVSVKGSGGGANIEISAKKVLEGTKKGDSISINGACQTVTSYTDKTFTVFASMVTMEVTTFSSFETGTPVNLERAMSASSRFGGHIVQGHVDCTGMVREITRDQNGLSIRISAPESIMKYIVAKGSVAVEGISLTAVDAGEDYFDLYIIPETVSETTIRTLSAGTKVNIEVDILAKYVERMLDRRGNGVRDDKLKKALMENGFV